MSTVAARIREKEGHKFGGSPEAIKHHYDIGNDFWRLVLGPTYTYSAALFTDANDDLETAQNRKITWHLASANAHNAKSVLEVGCGWGTILKRLSDKPSIERIVGLTLSEAQARHLRAQNMRNVEVRVENWATYEPQDKFDSIVSIGAFEHFAKLEESPEEKLAVYREFFERCHRWLAPSGRMSLQTIAYGTMKREQANPFMYTEIYPESDLPTMSDVIAAVDGLFEIVAFRSDRFDYARSYDAWLRNLRERRAEAVKMVGEEEVRRFEKFFKIGSIGFRAGKLQLHRYTLRPIGGDWAAMGAELPTDAVRLLA